jgi:3D (Asp-Asp-Asp) domain-containing protein
MALMIISMIIAPKTILAATAKDTNETKTDKDIDNLIIDNGVIKKNSLAISDDIKSIGKKFIINASAYTAAADECGKSDGITASGLKVREGETIACPAQFAFGTKINIEGLGTYICEDRGGAIKGNHIDIYVETKSKAFAFGRQNLLAQVVE